LLEAPHDLREVLERRHLLVEVAPQPNQRAPEWFGLARADPQEEVSMAPITASVEIARSPEDVFAYIADFPRHPEWQDGLVSVTVEKCIRP
jgi:Polyketide cyclase / dehydrase and lipid transport